MDTKLPPDSVLAETYGALSIPADRLSADPALFQKFVSALPQEFQAVDECQLKHRLINLRKQGKLPRTQR
jgi:hypothetical protein